MLIETFICRYDRILKARQEKRATFKESVRWMCDLFVEAGFTNKENNKNTAFKLMEEV